MRQRIECRGCHSEMRACQITLDGDDTLRRSRIIEAVPREIVDEAHVGLRSASRPAPHETQNPRVGLVEQRSQQVRTEETRGPSEEDVPRVTRARHWTAHDEMRADVFRQHRVRTHALARRDATMRAAFDEARERGNSGILVHRGQRDRDTEHVPYHRGELSGSERVESERCERCVVADMLRRDAQDRCGGESQPRAEIRRVADERARHETLVIASPSSDCSPAGATTGGRVQRCSSSSLPESNAARHACRCNLPLVVFGMLPRAISETA